jgi:hypothetical protein
VLYGCETWSLTLKENRLRGLENRVLGRIFDLRGSKWQGWRKLHNEELHNLYSSPDIIRAIKSNKDEMGGTCSAYEEMRKECKIFVRKPEWKIPLGRYRRRWEVILK